jgi:hypothetical protein
MSSPTCRVAVLAISFLIALTVAPPNGPWVLLRPLVVLHHCRLPWKFPALGRLAGVKKARERTKGRVRLLAVHRAAQRILNNAGSCTRKEAPTGKAVSARLHRCSAGLRSRLSLRQLLATPPIAPGPAWGGPIP